MREEHRRVGWQVPVEFRRSHVHGTGVFTGRAIAAGTRVWQVDESMHVCDGPGLATLRPAELRFALHGGYLHGPSGRFLWYRDGMQFMNHRAAPDANVGLGTWPPLCDDHCVALRDIEAGEELFEDYTFWCGDGVRPEHWLHGLYAEHCPEHFAFLEQLGTFRAAA